MARTRTHPDAPLLVLELQRATHAVALQLDTLLADLGLSQGEAHVLALLVGGAPHAVGELQRGLHHRASTLSGILDRLESRRLIKRALNQSDRRSFLIALTGSGHRVAAKVLDALQTIESETLAQVTGRDVDGFLAVTRALVEDAVSRPPDARP